MIYKILAQQATFTPLEILNGLRQFTLANYSWYIEMYLGLFLLIPFLNIVYNGLPSQKAKLWLVITMLILTALPAVVNIYNFDTLSWWKQPSTRAKIYKLIL